MSDATKRCPFCAEEIQADAMRCKHCGSFLDGRPVGPGDYPPLTVTVPIAVSAAANIIGGLGWLGFLCGLGLPVTIVMFLVAAYEISTYMRAPLLSPQALHSRSLWLGIFQIIVGFGNFVSLICGILLLIARPQLLEYRELG